MVKVTEIAFTGYPVTDIARARAFYEGVLKLELTRDYDMGEAHWIEYDVGPGTLAITNMSKDWKPSSSGPAIALEFENFDDAIAAMKAAGTAFLIEPKQTPGCRLAVVLDPDGNSLALHKRNPS